MNRHGNPPARCGVYSGMCRSLLVLFCVGTAWPQTDPIVSKLETYWKARREGRFADAAALREEACAILQRLPADAGAYVGWVQQVAGMYQNAGRTAEARSVLEEALARAGKSSTSSSILSSLYTSLAQIRQQDGNLLRAAMYQEQAITEATKPAASEPRPPAAGGGAYFLVSGRRAQFRFGPDLAGAYQQLAELDRQLGRREAVQAIVSSMRELAAKQNDGGYAWFFQRYGSPGEAAAMFRQQIDTATTPQQSVNASQQLANFYAAEGRFEEAIAAVQSSITAARASGMNDIWPRQVLISILQQAGRTEEVDGVYQQMLSGAANSREGDQVQVLFNYANYLSGTKRGVQAEAMLRDYRSTHPNLDPGQDSGILFALSNAARSLGDQNLADTYRKQAEARRPGPEVSTDEQSIAADLYRAQSLAQDGKTDEALTTTLQAIDRAARAPDREQIVWLAPQIANILAQRKAGGAIQPIYDRLFAELETWAADTPQPLLSATENYLRFLFSQRDRWAEVPAVLDRYRELAQATHGPDSAAVRNVLQMTVDFQNARNAPDAALRAASELAAFEDSLSGDSSEAYLGALRTLAECQARAGEIEAALATYRKRIEIADAGFPEKEMIRGYTRTDAAQALARQGRFEEAERLVADAVELSQNWPRQATFFTQQQEAIRKMRLARTSR